MIHSEYTRSLNCNYLRIKLEEKPEEKRYQYCILSRGGIKSLLPCDLRYINGEAYLYYDITSRQNLVHMYKGESIGREWIKDFLWSLRQVQQELERFLLDTGNVLWYPEQIYKDLETNAFCFLYVPYYEGDCGLDKLMEFLAENLNYDDEVLVDCVYHMYEQQERLGGDYLQRLIYEDTKCLEEMSNAGPEKMSLNEVTREENAEASGDADRKQPVGKSIVDVPIEKSDMCEEEVKSKKAFLGLFEGKKARNKKQREEYRRKMHREMAGFAVAEEVSYRGEKLGSVDADEGYEETEDYGRTIYVEAPVVAEKVLHRLLSTDGKLLAVLEAPVLTIGKKKEEADLIFEEASVSRMHARIVQEKEEVYLEDLNSTNGTFKNGLRLQPYEKRRLDEGDEIRCGRVSFVFR